jgi:hypothetical protein
MESDIGSIEDIARSKWSSYDGDSRMLKEIHMLCGWETSERLRATLQATYTEGFKQGVMLRLTGETDAHG